MATRTTEYLEDDVLKDGTLAEHRLTFSIDNKFYEIDLCDENAELLRNNVASWAQHGRKVSTRKRNKAKK